MDLLTIRVRLDVESKYERFVSFRLVQTAWLRQQSHALCNNDPDLLHSELLYSTLTKSGRNRTALLRRRRNAHPVITFY